MADDEAVPDVEAGDVWGPTSAKKKQNRVRATATAVGRTRKGDGAGPAAEIDAEDVFAQPPSRPDAKEGGKRKRSKKPQAQAESLGAELRKEVKKFRRGPEVATAKIKDKKLRGELRRSEALVSQAAVSAAKVQQWLLPSEAGTLEPEGMERTWQYAPAQIAAAATAAAGRKAFELALPELGPYALAFTPNGRDLLLGGAQGHLAAVEWGRGRLVVEVQVREAVRAITWLHSGMFFATAQKRHVYIYDRRGVEVHCLREHTEPSHLEFLPRHFLLASIGAAGILRYQDTSTGAIVAQLRTRTGVCGALRQDAATGVLFTGHGGGAVALWAPNCPTPLVKMLCHVGPVRALAVDAPGRHLVTAGADGRVRVWDLRTYRPLHAYHTDAPVTAMDISQRGLLAVGYGARVQVWRDALSSKQRSPYLSHRVGNGGGASAVASLRFCPYEDVLGVGHAGGYASWLVPGAGEPNYDSLVADPYQTAKQRREAEVHALLDKLQPEMIVLDPTAIGAVRVEPADVAAERRAETAAANARGVAAQQAKNAAKTRMKGKNSASKRHRKKRLNIIAEVRDAADARRLETHGKKKGEEGDAAAAAAAAVPTDAPLALRAFYKGATRRA